MKVFIKILKNSIIFYLEDVSYMRYKIDELYMCSLSCFAATGWDLQLLIKKLIFLKNKA